MENCPHPITHLSSHQIENVRAAYLCTEILTIIYFRARGYHSFKIFTGRSRNHSRVWLRKCVEKGAGLGSIAKKITDIKHQGNTPGQTSHMFLIGGFRSALDDEHLRSVFYPSHAQPFKEFLKMTLSEYLKQWDSDPNLDRLPAVPQALKGVACYVRLKNGLPSQYGTDNPALKTTWGILLITETRQGYSASNQLIDPDLIFPRYQLKLF